MWSPARARGAGRNDIDAGQHRPQSLEQEQATKTLTIKRSLNCCTVRSICGRAFSARIDRLQRPPTKVCDGDGDRR
jgi:hypothetical protein